MNFFENKIKHSIRVLLNKEKAGYTYFNIFPSDVFITSYPKSGNTWMRFIIANLLFPKREIGLTNIENIIPDIYKKSDNQLLKVRKPRILKSHEVYNPRYPKVIYIVRDVRSVIVSYYEYKKRNNNLPKGCDSISKFAKKLVDDGTQHFGTWNRHVQSWLATVGTNNDKFLLVRYEDLKTHGVKTVEKVCDFLEWEKSKEEIRTALEQSRFEKLKNIEQQQWDKWNENKRVSKNYPFFRSGSTNEWKERLDESTQKTILQENKNIMKKLNYLN